jgi:hypothetical protein
MTNPIAKFIGDINTRLKRLEEDIGATTDSVLRFMSMKEDVGAADYIYIYKRDVNTSFLLGHGILGVTLIGDRRSAPVLLYLGDGT